MTSILLLSAQNADQSNSLSGNIADVFNKITGLLDIDISLNIEDLNYIIRKSAHFFSYMVLGVLLSLFFEINGVKGIRMISYTLLISVIYAFYDEIHQLFVPGRAGQLIDVVIDGLGACSGAIIFFSVRSDKKLNYMK